MSNNKILGIFVAIIFTLSCYFTQVAMCWEDRPDMAFIDHFVDFHLDIDAIVKDAEEQRADKTRATREYIHFVEGVRDWGNDEGTCTYTPDRDN